MTSKIRYAACDVGTNAVRMSVSRVVQGEGKPFLATEGTYRLPLRLGEDVFADGKVGKRNQDDLVKAFQAFAALLAYFRPKAVRACATSALRDAENGAEAARRVLEEAGIDLEVISGAEEARLVLTAHATNHLPRDARFLCIDIGGGSTQLSILDKGRSIRSESFRIGGVRVLAGKVAESEWERMYAWIDDLGEKIPEAAIGTGGNIEKLHELVDGNQSQPFERKKLHELVDRLAEMTIVDRIQHYDLKPDRADVIVPAGRICYQVLKRAGIRTMHVPRTGIRDGIVSDLFRLDHGFAPEMAEG